MKLQVRTHESGTVEAVPLLPGGWQKMASARRSFTRSEQREWALVGGRV
jgi:hypothetical protein